MKRIILLPILLSLFVNIHSATHFDQGAYFLPLPEALDNQAVYHVKAHQVDDFCCGYNCLYNACNIEEMCGIPNCFSDYTIFKETCLGHLAYKNINPKDPVFNSTLEIISKEYLGLQKRYYTEYNCKRACGFHVEYLPPLPKNAEVHQKPCMHVLPADRAQELFTRIRYRLNTSNNPQDIVHFMFGADKHIILISLIQNPTGRGLYIFDNTNTAITEGSKTKLFIDYLCKFFCISLKNQFSGPYIPYVWKTTPQHMHR